MSLTPLEESPIDPGKCLAAMQYLIAIREMHDLTIIANCLYGVDRRALIEHLNPMVGGRYLRVMGWAIPADCIAFCLQSAYFQICENGSIDLVGEWSEDPTTGWLPRIDAELSRYDEGLLREIEPSDYPECNTHKMWIGWRDILDQVGYDQSDKLACLDQITTHRELTQGFWGSCDSYVPVLRKYQDTPVLWRGERIRPFTF